jgi:lipopolysaccharide/colanic/teichoic acid biosynthesis glycosyltransferase
MYRNLYPSDYSVANRALLFVGFDDDFDANIQCFPYESPSYQYTIENNAFKAFRWLEERVEQLQTFQLPYGILCRLDWLVENDFLFVRQLAAHPDLRFVPIIALTEHGTMAEHQAILTNRNVDDCYSVPVDWDKLEMRLEFLNQFKPQVLEQKKRLKKESFELKRPRQKRVFDVLAASTGIILSSWIWLPVMVAIWLESRGPVIYKSKRVGFGYQVIDFLKFRSMYVDSDQQLHEVQHLNQYDNPGGKGSVFVKIPQDPRVTRVGRFIRKYSIDELPQLLNVLRGDMSLVGNRPLPLYEAEMLTKDAWSERFLAPAGITGLWQVSKRGEPKMSSNERIMLDVQYSKSRFSVQEDMKIALLTLLGAFVQKEDV